MARTVVESRPPETRITALGEDGLEVDEFMEGFMEGVVEGVMEK
ncbi:hypothetical protein IMCC1989_1028 [gamma proteobacterium IMCC1989]|nr:hypothetical protein IMCC1989_1028 [gamma proteobacterium IMCC1989]